MRGNPCLRLPTADQGREHEDFVVRLKDFVPHRDGLLESIAAAPAVAAGFDVQVRTGVQGVTACLQMK